MLAYGHLTVCQQKRVLRMHCELLLSLDDGHGKANFFHGLSDKGLGRAPVGGLGFSVALLADAFADQPLGLDWASADRHHPLE